MQHAPVHESTVQSAPALRMFLSAAEVGQQLGLHKSRVYELAAAGLLPVVRLGRRMLFPRRGLEQIAEAAIERARARLTEDFKSWPPSDSWRL
jgi:excisionase family DNA binding protein